MKCEIMNNEKQNEYIYIYIYYSAKPVKLILEYIISISGMKCEKVNVLLNYKIKFCKIL